VFFVFATNSSYNNPFLGHELMALDGSYPYTIVSLGVEEWAELAPSFPFFYFVDIKCLEMAKMLIFEVGELRSGDEGFSSSPCD
jgi:hypothetical protein